jgi:hypothetical protein
MFNVEHQSITGLDMVKKSQQGFKTGTQYAKKIFAGVYDLALILLVLILVVFVMRIIRRKS